MFFSQVLGIKCSPNSLPKVTTPLGDIAFSVELNGNDTTAKASDCFSLPNGERLFRYKLAEASFELLIFRSSVNLLPHQRVEGCLTCAIRLTSNVNDLELRFSGFWLENNHPDGGGDTGERLMAMTWENPQSVVSLGTGDVEYHYPHAGKSFPLRWKQFLPEYLSPESMNKQAIPFIEIIDQRGLAFEPPSLMRGEGCQLAFAVAWADFVCEDDISTHVAVDDAHRIERDDFLSFRPYLS